MSDITVTHTDEKVTVGRSDYGCGFTATIVLVGDERFAQGRTGTLYRECWKCREFSGSLPEFAGIYEGVCFACTGRGYSASVESEAKAISLAKRRVSDRERRARKAQEKEAAQAAALTVWKTANPEVAAAAQVVMADAPVLVNGDPDYQANDEWIAKWGDFVTSLANQAQFRPLSAKQTEAFLPAFEQAKVDHAAEVDAAAKLRYLDAAVGAKVTVTGTIAVSTSVEGYMPGTSSRLVIVEGTGDFEGVTLKMIGTSKVMYATERGQAVEVTATVKDFSEYNDVPQTVVKLPKFRVIEAAV